MKSGGTKYHGRSRGRAAKNKPSSSSASDEFDANPANRQETNTSEGSRGHHGRRRGRESKPDPGSRDEGKWKHGMDGWYTSTCFDGILSEMERGRGDCCVISSHRCHVRCSRDSVTSRLLQLHLLDFQFYYEEGSGKVICRFSMIEEKS